MPFHYYVQTQFTAGAFSSPLTPGTFPRVGTEADTWAHYRFLSLRFRIHPTGSISTDQVFGFVGGAQDTPPATIATASEVLSSVVLSGDTSVPSEWCNVSRLEISGPLPWYKTIAGTADPTEESPGWLFGAGTGTDALRIEFRGVIEFKVSVATANTPLARQARLQLHEERLIVERVRMRELLLKLLAGPSSGTGTPGVSALGSAALGLKP